MSTDQSSIATSTDTEAATPARTRRGLELQKFALLGALLLLFLAFFIATPNFLTISNISGILLAASVTGILALGTNFVIATGGIDLSVGTGMTLFSVLLAVLGTSAHLGLPLPVAILLTLVIGALVGMFVGFLVSYMKIPAFIATLAMMMATQGLSLIITSSTPQYFTEHAWFRQVATGQLIPRIPNAVFIFAVVALVAWFLMNRTLVGRYAIAIGSNAEATKLSGVNTRRWTMYIYMTAFVFTAVAGIVMASRLNSAQPALGVGYELEAIAAVVIGGTSLAGGRAAIGGTVIGAILMATLNNGLQILGIAQEWQRIAVAIVILIAVWGDSVRRHRAASSPLAGDFATLAPDSTRTKETKMSNIARRTLGAGVLGVLGLPLVACNRGTDSAGGGSDGGGETAGSGPSIAIISKGFSQQFWVTVRDGAFAAAEELGAQVSFDGPDTESDVEQQIQQLQTALNGSPDAIAYAALDSEASLPLLEQAQSGDVPVIAFDSGVESDIPISTVATDNAAAAEEAAEKMVELVGEEGSVAVIAHSQTSLTGVQRRDGFVDYIEANTSLTIADIQYSDSDVLKSTNATNAILQAHQDLKGIFATNEASAIGMVTAIDELGRKDGLVVLGFDSGQGQLDAIRDGRMEGAVTQDPYDIGYKTVETALAAINGEDVEPEVDTGYYFYDESNMEDEKIARSLYE